MDRLNSNQKARFTKISACTLNREIHEENDVMNWFRFLAAAILVSCTTIFSPAYGQSVFDEFLYGIKRLEPPKPRVLPIAGKATFDFTFTDIVTVFRFSPDGRQIAVGLTDGTVRLRGKTDGEAWRFSIFESAVTDLRFSPNGRQITAYSDEQNVVKTWDISPTGKILSTFTLDKPWQRTQSVISQDGQYVALAGNQAINREVGYLGIENYYAVPSPYVRVYQARTGKLLSRFRPKGGRASTCQLSFGPVGSRTLHVIDADFYAGGSVQVWDFNNPQPVDPKHSFSIPRGHNGLMYMGFYASEEKLLTNISRSSNYSGSIGSGLTKNVATADLEMMDWTTGNKSTLHPCPPLHSMVTRSDTEILSVSYSINEAVLSPKADRIVVLTTHADDTPYPDENPELILMDLQGQIIGTIPGVGISHSDLAFSPDGARLAASSGKSVRFWEVARRAYPQPKADPKDQEPKEIPQEVYDDAVEVMERLLWPKSE